MDSPENSVQGKGLYHTRGVALTRTGCAGHSPRVTHLTWHSAWLRHFSRLGATPRGQGLRPDTLGHHAAEERRQIIREASCPARPLIQSR